MYKITLFLIASLFAVFSLYAQEQQLIQGSVSDASGTPIAYASYAVLDAASGKPLKGGLVDSVGHFSLEALAKGNYQVNVSAIGYQETSVALAIPGSATLSVQLAAADNAIEAVTISARRVQPIEQRPDRMVMNVAGSVLAAGNTVYDLLSMAPAVSVAGDGISVQGKSNVLIILDGRRLPNASLKDLLSAIPGDQIERMEIITNPSAKYDADAGSVIEIYTKNKGGVDAWSANASLHAAQGKLFHSGANLGLLYNKNKLSFNLSGSYTNTGHLEQGGMDRDIFQGHDAIGELQLDKDLDGRIGVWNLASGLSYQLQENQRIGVDVNVLNSDIQMDGGLESRRRMYAPEESENTPIAMDLGLLTAMQSVNSTYSLRFDSLGSSLDVSGNYTHYVNRQNQTFLPFGLPDQNVFNDVKANYDIFTGAVDYQKLFSENSSLAVGAKYTNTRNNSQDATGNEAPSGDPLRLGYEENILGLYANYEQGITDYLSLQVGLRAEHTDYALKAAADSSYWNFFPKARLDFTLSKQYSTSLYYAANISRPNYSLLVPYTRYFDTYTVQVGNPSLRPEYSHTFGWSHRYHNYSLSLEYQHVKDAISNSVQYDESNTFFINKMLNFSKRQLWAANLTIPFKVGGFWQSFNTLGAYHQSLDLPDPFSGDPVSRSNNYISFNTNNVFTLSQGWDMDLSAFYTGDRLRGVYIDEHLSNVSFGVRKQVCSAPVSSSLSTSSRCDI